MIIHLSRALSEKEVTDIAQEMHAIHFADSVKHVLITSSSVKELPKHIEQKCSDFFVLDNDMQLSNKKYRAEKRTIDLGNIQFGGTTKNTVMMAGPCSVESEEQIYKSATLLKEKNIKILRAG
ncbi:MAG: hypothetical protein C0594_16235 [Marinilabiliales bacterium]|nr:MAG: hypothetical protein C0594_16235 [Marinilabiliales bacterium]